jgi:hypothetical protein
MGWLSVSNVILVFVLTVAYICFVAAESQMHPQFVTIQSTLL